jgi:hypothetical protein
LRSRQAQVRRRQLTLSIFVSSFFCFGFVLVLVGA